MLQVFGGNLMTKAFEMASSAALNFVSTVKDAAAQGIEMAKAGEGIRVAFDRLNRPDLLDKLREATHNTVTDLELMKQAVKFNDFRLNLDQMGTLLAFAQQKAKDTGQSVDYMVDSIVTGLGRQSLMILDNLGLSASEIKERMKETGDMTTAVADIIKDQMSKAGDYVETAADRAAKADTDLKNAMEALGQTLLPLEEQGVSMWNSLEIGALKLLNDGVKPLVPVLLNLKDTIGNIAESVSNSSIWDGYVSALGTVADKAAQAAGPLGKVYMLMKMIAGGSGGNVGEGASVGALGLPDYTVDNIPEIVVTGNLSKKKTKGGSGSSKKTYAADSIAAQQALVQQLSQQWNEAGADVRNSYLQPLIEAEAKLKTMKDQQALLKEQAQGRLLGNTPDGQSIQTTGLGSVTGSAMNIGKGLDTLPEHLSPLQQLNAELAKLKQNLELSPNTEAYQAGLQAIADKEKEIAQFKGMDDLANGAKGTSKSFSQAASAIGQVGSALNSIEDPTAKVMATVAQAIATIAMAYSEALAKDKTNKSNIWYFIATAGAAMASMATTIASIHSATGYAEGGMIKGNSYSGDNLMAMGPDGGLIGLNAGEIVLNKAQSANLATSLQQGGGGTTRIVGVLKGEDIVLMADRWGMRTGRGELLFAKNL